MYYSSFSINTGSMIEILFLILVAVLFVVTVKSTLKPRNFPPGPIWYPYFGCSSLVYSMTKKCGSQMAALKQLAKEYSTDVLGLNVGGERLVVFYGDRHLKKVLNAEEFDGRPDTFFMRLRCFGERAGISASDGLVWKIHRRFTVTHLGIAGLGKVPMEKDIEQAALGLVDWIKGQAATPLRPKKFLSLAIMNVLWKCAAGEQISEEKWHRLQTLLEERSKVFDMAGWLLNRAPWLRFLLPGYTKYSLILEVNRHISDMVEEVIQKHKNKEITENDFVNAFLKEMEQNRPTFTEFQLKVTLLDLILAGSSTTASTTEFAILQALRDQDMQRKIQDEIDQVLGGDMPSWADSARMPYTSAFLLEVQRFFSVSTYAGPRRALDDIEIDGYFIPKDTTVLLSLNDLHHDPNPWEDPFVFKPERFIDEDGTIKQMPNFYPFGLGRRRCPGDALARSFIFASFASILQQFSITADDLPSIEPDCGMVATAKPFKAIFTLRKTKH